MNGGVENESEEPVENSRSLTHYTQEKHERKHNVLLEIERSFCTAISAVATPISKIDPTIRFLLPFS